VQLKWQNETCHSENPVEIKTNIKAPDNNCNPKRNHKPFKEKNNKPNCQRLQNVSNPELMAPLGLSHRATHELSVKLQTSVSTEWKINCTRKTSQLKT